MSQAEVAGPCPDWDAATYDTVADPQTRWGAAVLDRLPLRGNETVIDAGCGSGRVTERLLARLPEGRVVALDASAAMLKAARRRLGSDPRVSFHLADLMSLGPADVAVVPVDAILSTATFHWVLDHDKLFNNLKSVLRPGGKLVAQCGARHNVERLSAVVRSLGIERAGSWLYASVDETRQRLLNAGFVDVAVWTTDEPTRFVDVTEFRDFLEAVCLRESLASMEGDQRLDFLEAVVRAMPDRIIDYVRLNIVATNGGGG